MIQSESAPEGVPDPRAIHELPSTPAAPGIGGAGGEVELVLRAQRGDRTAFAKLHQSYASTVHGILISMVAPQDAADLTQEVFLSALNSIGGLTQPERVGPWLCTIARNRARDSYKARARDVEFEEVVHGTDARPETSGVEEQEEASRILNMLQTLPDAYRETLTLRLVEGFTGPEIAERTGLTHGSVRVNLHRGMKLLREMLEEEATGGRA